LESSLQSMPTYLGEQHAQESALKQNRIQELEASLAEATQALAELTDTHSKEKSFYQQQLAQSEQHLSALQNQVNQLQYQLEIQKTPQNQASPVESQEQLRIAEQRAEDLQIQLNYVSRQLQESLESAPRYQKLYEQQQTEIRKALTLKQRLSEDLAEQKRIQADIENQFKAQRQLDQDKIHALETELVDLKRERDSLTQQIQQSQKEDRLRELRDQITLLREQLNQERFQRSNLERELSKTKSSGSTPSEASSFPKITTEKSAEKPIAPGALEPSADRELLELAAFGRATPWVQRVLTQLRAAGLLSIEDVDQILLNWEQDGGTFTNILSKFTGLRSETVKFFSEGGYSVRLAGARSVGDYLQASGLITSSQIQLAQARVGPGKDICQVLVEQGLLAQATADYFTATFNQQTSSQANKSKFSFRDRLS
jgi:chemotaxis protein histidine kinase CheA